MNKKTGTDLSTYKELTVARGECGVRIIKIRVLRSTESFLVAQMVENLLAMQETWVYPWVGKIPCRREWQPTAVFLPGEFMGRGAW